MKPSLSIVVVNYNTLDLLKECIYNLLNFLFFIEIIIIDNSSNDGSSNWLVGINDQRVKSICLPENRGFAAGCNAGISQTSGEYILLLNTDAFPTQQALEILVEHLEQHPETGIVGPQLLYANGRWQRSGGRMLSPNTAILDALGITSLEHTVTALLSKINLRAREIGYVDGACMLIRRAVIEQIGGLDERFFFFVEDAEFCHRARQNGWRVDYVPQSRVIHLRGGSSSQKNFQKSAAMQLASRKIFIEQVYGKSAWSKTAFWLAANYSWRYIACRIVSVHSAKCVKYQYLHNIYRSEYRTLKGIV